MNYRIFLFAFFPLFGQEDSSKPSEYFHLQTKENISPISVEETGSIWIIGKERFPALEGVTCYVAELWDESMRLPHWHPNAAELGYVLSGKIEISLWLSPGESSLFTVGEGMCWFIPQGALHSLNNLGEEKAELLVGFSSDEPQNIDLPVAFNGIPAPLRDAYTSPHSELRKWKGPIDNPLVGKWQAPPSLKEMALASPYQLDFARVTPLFNNSKLGSVIWGVKENWPILQNISILRAHLKPGVARDAIWYPDVGTLYVVSQGKGQFYLIQPGEETKSIEVGPFDYIFVPVGTLHTFLNTSSQDFEVIALFTKEDPHPEVSLAIATSFLPKSIAQAAMTQYSNVQKTGTPLQFLRFQKSKPYLVPIFFKVNQSEDIQNDG